MKTIIAGTDPVALDYYGAKHLVYFLSKNSENHNPDNPKSAVAKFLLLAQKAWGKGATGDPALRIHEYDCTMS